MASDNDVETTVKEAPSAGNAAVTTKPLEAPTAGPSTNPSEGDNIALQEMNKTTEYMPATPGLPWKWPHKEILRKEFVETYSQKEKDDALERTVKVVKKYSDDMIKRLNEEIDTRVIVYAGLFSAILSTFNVQSYLLLQPSNPDPTLLVLQQISQQLNSFSVTPTGAHVNSTHHVSFAPIQASPVEPWAVCLNSLWFSGLILSLATASIGIMVKQWIHEYEAGISGDSLEITRLRQYRLNNLEKWHVAEIVACLPTLLLTSLFLFFSGLLILLWHYHSTVAIIASVLIGMVTLFVIGTTIMPLFWRSCCYLSPPVYLLYNIVQYVKHSLKRFRVTICRNIYRYCRRNETFLHMPLQGLGSWAVEQLWTPVTFNTRRGREQSTVQSASPTLDVDMTVHAYSTTIDTRHLSDAGAILTGYGFNDIHKHFTEVQMVNEQHFGQKGIQVLPADEMARQVFYSISDEDSVEALWMRRESYRDSLSSSTYHRLLLALAAAVSKTDVTSLVYWRSLCLLGELFTFNPDALELMPWNAVQRVAAAMETQLRRLLCLWDDEHVQEVSWYCVLILVRCCFAPVSSWERSPEEMRACMQYLLGLDFLQKQPLREKANKMGSLAAVEMMKTLTIILPYLGDSADTWDCRPAAEGFMESARTVIETFEGKDDDSLKTPLQELKDRFRECKSLLAKQITSAQPAEIEGPPELIASGALNHL